MHYEIFKYLNNVDLLAVRGTKLGGYQLTSNSLLRSRIQNYFYYLSPNLELRDSSGIFTNLNRIELIFGQTGNEKLDFGGMKIGAEGFIQLAKTLKLVHRIQELNLCKYGVYI